MLHLFTFFYIFGFKIYSIIDSTILIGAFLTIKILVNRKLANIFKKKITNRHSLMIFISYLFLLGLATFACAIGNVYDFSYIETLIHLGIVVIIGYELASFYEYKGKSSNILNHIIVAFLTQSIFQWICYIFPTFSQYFNYFRSRSMVERTLQLGGYRGLALSQSGFFGLSSSYALVILLYFSKNNSLTKNVFVKYILFGILLTGTFFAGRTGYVGVILIPLLLFSNCEKKKFFIKRETLKKIAIVIICIVFFLEAVSYMPNNPKTAKLYNYTFELFNNYKNGKGFRSTSTDGLLDMYDIDIPVRTFLIGDGQYTNNDGSYYHNVDIGYYRKILYFGIFGLIISIWFQISLFANIKKKKETLVIILLLLILELKGEIIGLNIMINAIITLYSNIKSTEKKEGDKHNGETYNLNDNLQ